MRTNVGKILRRLRNLSSIVVLTAKKRQVSKPSVFIQKGMVGPNFHTKFRVTFISHGVVCKQNEKLKLSKFAFLYWIPKSTLRVKLLALQPEFIFLAETATCSCLRNQTSILLGSIQYKRVDKSVLSLYPQTISYQKASPIAPGVVLQAERIQGSIKREVGLLSTDLSIDVSQTSIDELHESRFKSFVYKESSKNSRTLVQKYQALDQKEGIHGLGDFVFGCLKVSEFADTYGLIPMIDISNHPISNFLVSTTHATGPVKNIFHGDSDLLFLKNQIVFTNKRPNSIPTTLYRDFVLSEALQFNESTETEFQDLMAKSSLLPRKYTVTHLRIGDHQLFRTNEGTTELEEIIARIKLHSSRNQIFKDSLFLSDSQLIRDRLLEAGFRTLNLPVAHLGNSGSNLDSVKFSLMEHRIMLRSRSIFQISAYSWGSAFSETASILGGIQLSTMNLQDFIQVSR